MEGPFGRGAKRGGLAAAGMERAARDIAEQELTAAGMERAARDIAEPELTAAPAKPGKGGKKTPETYS